VFAGCGFWIRLGIAVLIASVVILGWGVFGNFLVGELNRFVFMELEIFDFCEWAL
jgi:hypothetical protein